MLQPIQDAASTPSPSRQSPKWEKAFPLSALEQTGAKVTKIDGKQIAVFLRDGSVYACNNRCPHEGYPLKEGTLSETCTLTCNWHNWKFDLRTGDNKFGGDRLRVYPTEIRESDIWIDVSDPPSDHIIEAALGNLHDSFDRHEYDRMARELARLEKAGGDPMDALRATIRWTHEQFEFGMGSTHAFAATPDWLALGDRRANDPAHRLMPIHESIAYFAWDSRREPQYPFPEGRKDWDEEAFSDAIENEDEATAIALIRGALAAGMGWLELEPAFARAALRHYLDFGHGAIYVVKTGELIERLGDDIQEILMLSLTRGLITAWREDLIPEFRDYADIHANWGKDANQSLTPEDFEGLGPDRAMALAATSNQSPQELFDVVFEMSCRSFLRYDHLACQEQIDKPVSHNRTWLSFTHEITFANAARQLASRNPDLWPAALLQICCFFGRNANFLDHSVDMSEWVVDDPKAFLGDVLESLFDHGRFEYIVSAHLIKTVTAIASEVENTPDAPWVPTLLAALNRFLHAPLKRRYPMRVMTQALSFVAVED